MPADGPASAPDPADGTAAAAPARRNWWHLAETVLAVGAWCFIGLLAWTALTVWTDRTWPARVTVMLQSIVPLVFLPVWVLAPLAWWRDRKVMTAACIVLALVHVVLVIPAIGSAPTPGWVSSAPKLTVLSANVYDGNQQMDAAAREMLAQHADVMVLIEMTPEFVDALTAAGVNEQYPYRFVGQFRSDTGNVEGIYSTLPIEARNDIFMGEQVLHTALLSVNGAPLRVVAVHINSAIHSRDEWVEELHELTAYAGNVHIPLVLSGDFNATRWNPPFRTLLDAGFTDAHEARGDGLTLSWPNIDLPFLMMRIDHALYNSQVAAVGLHDVNIPGSDHIGFQVELAVRRQ